MTSETIIRRTKKGMIAIESGRLYEICDLDGNHEDGDLIGYNSPAIKEAMLLTAADGETRMIAATPRRCTDADLDEYDRSYDAINNAMTGNGSTY